MIFFPPKISIIYFFVILGDIILLLEQRNRKVETEVSIIGGRGK